MTSTLVYRFDNIDDYPILDTECECEGTPIATTERLADGLSVAILYRREDNDCRRPKIAIGLPPLLITGRLDHIEMRLGGDLAGTLVAIEASDELGWGMEFQFTQEYSPIDRSSADTGEKSIVALRAAMNMPTQCWSSRAAYAHMPTAMPLQPHRLTFSMPADRPQVHLLLHSLWAIGEVEKLPAGLAES